MSPAPDKGKNNLGKYILIALACLVLIIIVGKTLTKQHPIAVKKRAKRSIETEKLVEERAAHEQKEKITKEKPITEYTVKEIQKKTEEIAEAQYATFSKDTTQERRAKTRHDIYPSEEELKDIKKRKALYY